MILDFLLFGCGIYVLAQNIRMKVTGKVPAGLVNPKIKLENAPDTEGYINYTFVRGLIFGIVLVVVSGLLILQSFVEISPIVVFAAEVIYIGTLIYYAVVTVKAQNKYLFRISRESAEKKKSERIKRATLYVNYASQEEEKND